MNWPVPRPALKAAIAILKDAFPGVVVSHAMPKTRPAKIVIVSRIGGDQNSPRMDEARILIECWSKSIGDVEEFANTAGATLRNAAGTHVLGDVFIHGWSSQDGPVEYDDPDVTDMTRWQLTGTLSVSTR